MKIYLLSAGVGLLVGILYSLLGVRSPAPPVVALVGLGGILIGEQIVPIAKRLAERAELTRFVREDCTRHVFGHLPANRRDETGRQT